MPGFGKSGMPRMWSFRSIDISPQFDNRHGTAAGGHSPASSRVRRRRAVGPIRGGSGHQTRLRRAGVERTLLRSEGAAMSETSLRNTDINAALDEVKEAYVTSAPRSLARHVDATAVMPGGNTRTVLHYAPFPLAMERAAGCRLWDLDGHEFVDFLGEYTAGIFGHSHPVIRAALDRALDGGINYGASNIVEARFARAVCERFGLERVRFTNSGTEANLLAISLARIFTGRKRVLVFDGGYHGAVFGFAGGGSPINAPFEYVVASYNDVDATRSLIARNASDLAVVILEPMIGSGGCIAAEPAFLSMLREETQRVGALLILDEVMTSRLSPGGLQAVHGITPDL